MSLNASLLSNGPREILEPNLAPVTIDWALECVSAPVRQALDYWTSLCGTRSMPRRHELSPFAMRRFLPHVNLVEPVRDRNGCVEDYVMILEGQHAQDIYGAVAHRRLDDVLPPNLAKRWRNGFEFVCQVARPVRFSSNVNAGGKSWLAGEAVIAPLGEEGCAIEALFVAFASWPAQKSG